ncbi:hypothetical protein N7466_007551 [Penicillium verhagenii]|uniref:uncharacterized protein n=1 Tax=Penicillium verhagenii TaxID=1562060 RepID=UPI002545580B|nr:uncharacterized protein N7466_007551 [Penicillium verhagenii]KAJ5928595.1 hypothetical protein N7466_007551 [Penicillium verhagenii]
MSCIPSPAGDPPTISARPKLTLQTTSLPRTFGSSTTGLSRSCTAAPGASPTVGNTFKNAYDIATPASATTSPSKGPSLRFPNKPISPYVHHSNNNNNPFNFRPYQLPLGVRSILRNSPLDTAPRRRSGSISAGTNSGPGGAGARRVFFPAKKQVSYRIPLEEEIRTERYTAHHLDLVHEEEEERSAQRMAAAAAAAAVAVQTHEAARGPETQPHISNSGPTHDSEANQSLSESSTSDEASADEGLPKSTLSKLERKKRRTMRTERQVRAVALLDGLEADQYSTACSTPQTPQGRVKRRREWKWTLGSLNTDITAATSSGSVSSATATPETPSVSSASTVDDSKPETQSLQDQ